MSRAKQKKKAVKLAKDIVKKRNDYTCERCGRSKAQGWQLHGAHVIPVGYDMTAADPENLLCLCAKCHSLGRDSAHDNPVEFSRWYNEKYPDKFEELRKKAYEYSQNPFPKIQWEDVIEELKEEE